MWINEMKKSQAASKAIKFLHENEVPKVRSRRIDSDHAKSIPEGCYILKPMVVLKNPEPIKVKRKAK
jgi:hypothetical protein